MFIIFSWDLFTFRFTRAFITPKLDYRFAETEAGKKFLTTLRQHHEEDDVDIKKVRENSPTDAVESKQNLKEMRSQLEGLLVAYLTNLSPAGEQISYEHLSDNTRKKRDNFESSDRKNSVNNISSKNVNNNDLDDNAVAIDISDSVSDDASNKTSAIKIENKKRVQIGVRNVTDTVVNSAEKNSNNTIAQSAQSECNLRNQRITVLDRFDLNNSMQRENSSEHNIRLLLNYR